MRQAIITMCLLIGVASYSLAAPLLNKQNKTNVRIEGKINFDDQYSMFVSAMDESRTDRIEGEEIDIQKNGSFRWDGYTGQAQFVSVTFTSKKRDRQLGATFPIYLRPGMKLVLDLYYSNTDYLTLRSGKVDQANLALFKYSNFSYNKVKALFVSPASPDRSKAFAHGYIEEADRLVQGLKKKDAIVKEYLTIWAFNNYQDALYSLERENSGMDKNFVLPADYYSLPKSPKEIYDNDLSLIIPQTIRHVNDYLARQIKGKQSAYNDLQAKTEALKQNFTNKRIVEAVGTSLLSSYISSYRIGKKTFSEDAKDFSTVAAIIQDEAKRNRIIKDFENLKYTLVGSEMPDVVFKDIDGKEVSLKSFKGKYVYIDLWASWCVPCIAEIPYLQKLEKEYADKNITFISLSIDESSTAWKKKVQELNLHGNQFEQGNSSFGKLMNVTGIPHFVIYNPEGKLEMYKAPRPSSPTIKVLFDQIL